MGTNESKVLETVANNTQSELLLFFIIVVVALVLVLIPLYTLILRDKKQNKSLDIERERQIIQVITANTEIMAGLKGTLETNGISTSASLERISGKVADMTGEHAQIKAMLERSISNQTEMASKINKVLLIVDSIPNTSNFSNYSREPQRVCAEV